MSFVALTWYATDPVSGYVEDTEVQTQLGYKYVALLLFVLVKYTLHSNLVIRHPLFKYSRMPFICFEFEFNTFSFLKNEIANKQLFT